jgi:hypothetical protein
MSEKARSQQRKRQKKEKYENEPKFEYVVIGLFNRRVVDWLYRQFEEVQFMQCRDDPQFCKQTREVIANNIRKYLEDMKLIDSEQGE